MPLRNPATFEILAVVACATVLASCRQQRPTAAVSSGANAYVDARQCAGCHPQIAQAYRRTGMARSFYPATAVPVGDAEFFHRKSGTYYSVTHRDGKVYQRRWRKGDKGTETDVEESAIDYVMGSGSHVRTFLRRTPRGALIELPLAWYAENGGSWAMNPGYDTDHALPPRKINYGCMFCHNGYPQIPAGQDTPGADPLYAGQLPEGIDCQRCHGPGGNHVSAAGAGAKPDEVRKSILNPARLPAERQLEVCMQCHLETTSFPLPNVIRRYGRDVFSYSPAEPLSTAMVFFDHARGSGREGKFEIVNSAYRLRQSQCFLRSSGSLTCTNCHDPHKAPGGVEAVAQYDRACRQCHKSESSHMAQANCAGCHMPKRRTEDVIHAVMTDHLIQRMPLRGLLAPMAERHEAGESAYHGEVVPYYPAGERGLYVAVAQVQQKSNLQAGIARLTSGIEKEKPGRPEFYLELGQALEAAGERDKSIAAYEEAVRRSPAGFALRKLGAALREAGQLSRAAEMLARAVQVQAGEARNWYELGLLESARGRKPEAIAALRKSVELDPDLDSGYTSLGSVLAETGDSADAEAAFRAALRIFPDSADAAANLALLLGGRNDLHQAAYYFERSLLREPNAALARCNYGIILARMERYVDAQRQLELAVRSDPALAEAHDVLGSLLERKGSVDAAIREYTAAVRARPDFGRAHLNLGSALAGKGDLATAVEHFKVAAGGSDPAVRQQAAQALAQLQSRPH